MTSQASPLPVGTRIKSLKGEMGQSELFACYEVETGPGAVGTVLTVDDYQKPQGLHYSVYFESHGVDAVLYEHGELDDPTQYQVLDDPLPDFKPKELFEAFVADFTFASHTNSRPFRLYLQHPSDLASYFDEGNHWHSLTSIIIQREKDAPSLEIKNDGPHSVTYVFGQEATELFHSELNGVLSDHNTAEIESAEGTVETYTFSTHAELQAFIEGVEAAYGALDCEIVHNDFRKNNPPEPAPNSLLTETQKQEIADAATAALPLSEDEWGSDRQVDAQNHFGDLLKEHLPPALFERFEFYALKATTEETVECGLNLLKSEW